MTITADPPPVVGEPEQPGAAAMSLWEHIAELRSRLVWCAVALVLGSVVGFIVSNQVLELLIKPYCDVTDGNCALVVLDPLEGFTTRIKIALSTGLLLASPVILWHLWRFVTPALHPGEKRYAIPFIASSIVLFLLGAAFAVVTLPRALEFLVGVGGPNLVPLFSPSRYLRLVLLMVVAFGVSFEFPVLLVFLQLAKVLSSKRLRQWRRGAYVSVFVLSAVITPSQDPITLFAMAVPMCLFYEGAIGIGRLLKR